MWIQRRGSKYSNVSKIYNGRSYMSHKEATYAWELDQRIKNKEIKEVIPQYRLSLDVNGYHICNYYVDFLVINNDGSKELHEVKGFQTDVFNLKWKLTEALFSDKFKLVLIK
jgi:uncharacterized protein (UPF0297 family)